MLIALLSTFVLCGEWERVNTQQHRGNVCSFILFCNKTNWRKKNEISNLLFFFFEKRDEFLKMKKNRFRLSRAGLPRNYWTTDNWQGIVCRYMYISTRLFPCTLVTERFVTFMLPKYHNGKYNVHAECWHINIDSNKSVWVKNNLKFFPLS